jgi:hypothetical protein
LLLLQGLVSKSEYNGKRACVRFFDDQLGRYTVKLDDDGKRIRLKPEFVVPDETDEPSLAVRAIAEFGSPFRHARPELWVVSYTAGPGECSIVRVAVASLKWCSTHLACEQSGFPSKTPEHNPKNSHSPSEVRVFASSTYSA